ncbi:MAG: HAMP domain-containing histidine kinase [Planctomycetota bacterium]|nr:HAMP domain-containing histidine kinase [Planctomycetota bacterium]
MGRLLDLQPSRTLVAFLLTGAALALPIAAWYVTGVHDVAERAKRTAQEEPRRLARQKAVVLAERLAERMRALAANEAKTPFYYYQNLYHDPKGASEGASIQISPLAQGPVDALIETYFQIDPAGRVSLPTYNPEVPAGNVMVNLEKQRQLLDLLQPAASSCAYSLREAQHAATQERIPPQTLLRPDHGPMNPEEEFPRQREAEPQALLEQASAPQEKQQQESAPQQQGPSSFPQAGQAYNSQRLDNEAWEQNVQANKLYADILSRKGRTQGKGEPENERGKPDAAGLKPAPDQPQQQALMLPQSDEVLIIEGEFTWHSIPVSGQPRLVALREVVTPLGTRTQGFLLSEDEIQRIFKSPDLASRGAPSMPARLEPGLTQRPTDAPLPIAGASWYVAVDPAPGLALGALKADEMQRSFLWTFWTGAGIAVVAGLCVVMLVWQADRLARQRAQFAASAAHELRTPLAGMRMYGEMLAEGLGDPNKRADYARRIADEAERLGRVVGNVLNFSRLERGVLTVHPEPGDLGDAVRQGLDRMRPALGAAGAQADLDVAADLPEVAFDREAIFQILQNLVDNAEKYSRGAADRTIRVQLAPGAQGGADLAVCDAGPGVPPIQQRHLFEPFRRGDDPDAPAGLGLGLALTQAMVRAQGGEIAYSSVPGGGACFTVRLPAATASKRPLA